MPTPLSTLLGTAPTTVQVQLLVYYRSIMAYEFKHHGSTATMQSFWVSARPTFTSQVHAAG